VKAFSLYIILGLATIVGQTTILRLAFFQGIFYDLLIPLVVFVGLSFNERKAGILVLMIGFLMDLFSGGIFGLYLTVYLWIFVLVKGLSNYFDVQDTVFRSVLIAVCVLAENLTFFVFAATSGRVTQLLSSRIGPVTGQIIFGAITGPVILLVLENIHARVTTPTQTLPLSKGEGRVGVSDEKQRQNL